MASRTGRSDAKVDPLSLNLQQLQRQTHKSCLSRLRTTDFCAVWLPVRLGNGMEETVSPIQNRMHTCTRNARRYLDSGRPLARRLESLLSALHDYDMQLRFQYIAPTPSRRAAGCDAAAAGWPDGVQSWARYRGGALLWLLSTNSPPRADAHTRHIRRRLRRGVD